jgi:carboxyl-terminal processing protease
MHTDSQRQAKNKKREFLIGAALFLFIASAILYAANEEPEKILVRIGRTVVLADPPQSLPLQQNLTQAEIEENFENLIQAVDRHFSFFIIKDIQWESICSEYREKLKEARSTTQFYRLVHRFISELKDAHSWLQDYEPKLRLDTFAPPISIRRIEGKPVVIDVWKQSKAYREGVRPGWVITAVDRKPVESYMKLLRNRVSVSSSERNLEEKITRMILCGKKESLVSLDFLTTDGEHKRGMKYARTVRYPETEPELPFGLTKLSKIWYGTHSSGFGYIRIISFEGRMEIADEFDQALAALRNTRGLIIDIRDNPGGYGTSQKRIIGRFLTSEAKGITSFRRNGPEHDDFEMIPESIPPSGDWQYTKPLGLLMNSITGSASDLFAARFASTGRVVTMGQTTHGKVTGVGVYVVLPCNLVVRISNGYIADSSGRVIEGNGNEPDITIEPTLTDAREYNDGVLERAFAQLQKKASQ